MAEQTPFSWSSANRTSEIPWREWGSELFEDEAIAEQPRLLVMAPRWHPGLRAFEQATLDEGRLARYLSTDVTPVRVDADERPDVVSRYGEAEEITVALLAPNGEPVARFREPTADILVEAIEAWQVRWRDEQDELLAELEAGRVIRQARKQTRRGDLTPMLLNLVLQRAGEADGLADPERVRLWLYAHRRRADLESERRARMAIQRRVDGDGFDHLSGAFPHCAACEVLLAADQGRWLLVLARIASEDSEAHEWVLETVTRTIEFLESELLNSSGGFALGSGDTRVLAASNALVARGLLACGIVFDRLDWRSRGRTAVDFLVRQVTAGEAGFYHVWDGTPHTLGLLSDQVAAGEALLDAYEVTGAIDYLHRAQTVARLFERRFQTVDGPLADTDDAHGAVALLEEPRFSVPDNVSAAELLIRLGHLTHDNRYVDMAYTVLEAVVGDLEIVELEAACALARVADRLLSVEAEVKIIAFAPPGEVDSVADALHAEALRLALASHTVQRVHPEFDDVLVAQLGVPVMAAGAVCFVSGGYSSLLTHADELLPTIEREMSLTA